MKKFVKHIDHVTWVARLENAETHVARLEALTDGRLVRFEREDMGFVTWIDWDAGIEIIAPLPAPTRFNRALHERLDSRGEGLLGVIFGVENLEKHRAMLEGRGIPLGPAMDDPPDSPWHDRIVLRERPAPPFMGDWFVISQIDYGEDMIRFEDVAQDD